MNGTLVTRREAERRKHRHLGPHGHVAITEWRSSCTVGSTQKLSGNLLKRECGKLAQGEGCTRQGLCAPSARVRGDMWGPRG
ncbi:hypothetical protein TIFTF001_039173 [Ficus carica]|uniref:Uncharacterized protein n=1 Tax=Ficus carica TaxID=3494 RepID=A0AA88JAR4_FICCA|nr:hypothetical protein TIFTF001_039173 [Ficus carica]